MLTMPYLWVFQRVIDENDIELKLSSLVWRTDL